MELQGVYLQLMIVQGINPQLALFIYLLRFLPSTTTTILSLAIEVYGSNRRSKVVKCRKIPGIEVLTPSRYQVDQMDNKMGGIRVFVDAEIQRGLRTGFKLPAAITVIFCHTQRWETSSKKLRS